MIDKLFFIGYQSLGDTFIFNGIAHHYAKLCNELHIPTTPFHLGTTSCLYQDFPNIKVVSMMPEEEDKYVSDNKMSRVIRKRLVYVNSVEKRPLSICFDMQYYDLYNLPFSLRYLDFKTPKHVLGADELYNQLVQNNEPYVLWHRKMHAYPDGLPIDLAAFRRSHNLPNMKIIEVSWEIDQGNILKWIKLIRNAAEIHVISGSFWALVDSVTEQTQARLFFHDIRNPVTRVNNDWNQHRWTIVNYAERIVDERLYGG